MGPGRRISTAGRNYPLNVTRKACTFWGHPLFTGRHDIAEVSVGEAEGVCLPDPPGVCNLLEGQGTESGDVIVVLFRGR